MWRITVTGTPIPDAPPGSVLLAAKLRADSHLDLAVGERLGAFDVGDEFGGRWLVPEAVVTAVWASGVRAIPSRVIRRPDRDGLVERFPGWNLALRGQDNRVETYPGCRRLVQVTEEGRVVTADDAAGPWYELWARETAGRCGVLSAALWAAGPNGTAVTVGAAPPDALTVSQVYTASATLS